MMVVWQCETTLHLILPVLEQKAAEKGVGSAAPTCVNDRYQALSQRWVVTETPSDQLNMKNLVKDFNSVLGHGFWSYSRSVFFPRILLVFDSFFLVLTS